MALPRTLVVTIPGMIAEEDLRPLRALSDVQYVELQKITQSDLAERCKAADYLMLNYDVVKHLDEQFYTTDGVRSLKAISFDMTGMDWASPAGATKVGLPLLNTPHYSTESVAESILSEVLLHSRQRHSAYVDEIRRREIQARSGINLVGRTAGVVGLGSIGTRVAQLLASIGMSVIAWNRSPREGVTTTPLPELFDKADVICICLKTVHSGSQVNVNIINDGLLSRCNGAIIVNLANADLVDHDAVARYIRTGKIAGYTVERSAALLASKLAELDAVHLPPSNAWSSKESLNTLRATWVGNIIAAIKGQYQNVYRD